MHSIIQNTIGELVKIRPIMGLKSRMSVIFLIIALVKIRPIMGLK